MCLQFFIHSLNFYIFSLGRLNDVGNGKAIRKSPRPAPKFDCSTSATNYGKESIVKLQATCFQHSVDHLYKGIANSDGLVSCEYSSEGMCSGGLINVGSGEFN